MPHPRPDYNERGAALLTVLLLVAIMSVISAFALERLGLGTRLVANSAAMQQARNYGFAAEELIKLRIGDALGQTGGQLLDIALWNGRTFDLSVPGGTVRATVLDGGNCFNLNSLVAGGPDGPWREQAEGRRQFRALMTSLGVSQQDTVAIAAAAADWIDSDGVLSPSGAEDGVYLSRSPSYIAPNRPMADITELLAVQGVTPELFARLRPWLCALPLSELSPININSIRTDQAPLIAMLLGEGATLTSARGLIAARPPQGFQSPSSFWGLGPLRDRPVSFEVSAQIRTTSRWIRARIETKVDNAEVIETVLFDAQKFPARVVARSWGDTPWP